MDSLGHHFFAGAAFARNENRNVRWRHPLDEFDNVVHSFGVPDDALESFSGSRRTAMEALINLMSMHCPLDHDFDFFETDWLAIIVKCSKTHSSQCVSVVIISGDNDDAGSWYFGEKPFD